MTTTGEKENENFTAILPHLKKENMKGITMA